jgi:hypothetical protein
MDGGEDVKCSLCRLVCCHRSAGLRKQNTALPPVRAELIRSLFGSKHMPVDPCAILQSLVELIARFPKPCGIPYAAAGVNAFLTAGGRFFFELDIRVEAAFADE